MTKQHVPSTVESNQPRELDARPTQSTREEERYLVPPVDIYETKEGLVVVADLPGVEKDDLNIDVEDDVLTIQARSKHEEPASAVYQEYRLMNFYRQFQLGEHVDQGKISAELKHGVLKLTLPKAEKAKPKKIEVRVS